MEARQLDDVRAGVVRIAQLGWLLAAILLASWGGWAIYVGLSEDPAPAAFMIGVLTIVLSFFQLSEGGDLIDRISQSLSMRIGAGATATLGVAILLLIAALAQMLHEGWLPRRAVEENRLGVEASETSPALAIAHFRRAIRIDPGLARAHYGLGGAYEASGEAREALREYLVAIQWDDQLVDAYNNAARLHLRNGLRASGLDDAIELLEVALEKLDEVSSDEDLDPVRYSVHKNLGWAYFEAGDLATAEVHLEEARNLAARKRGGSGAYCLTALLLACRGGRLPAISATHGPRPQCQETEFDEDKFAHFLERCTARRTKNDPIAPTWLVQLRAAEGAS